MWWDVGRLAGFLAHYLVLIACYLPGRWLIELAILRPRVGFPLTIDDIGSPFGIGTDSVRVRLKVLSVGITLGVWGLVFLLLELQPALISRNWTPPAEISLGIGYGLVLIGLGGICYSYARKVIFAAISAVSNEPEISHQEASPTNGRSSRKPRRESAYEILGVSPTASRGEVVSAYHRLAKMYHPDRVAHLAPEFQRLAEERMKEINAAYAEVVQNRN